MVMDCGSPHNLHSSYNSVTQYSIPMPILLESIFLYLQAVLAVIKSAIKSAMPLNVLKRGRRCYRRKGCALLTRLGGALIKMEALDG